MKSRNVIISFFLLLYAFTSEGQENKFVYGLQVGPGVSFVITNSRNVYDPQLAASGGFNAKYMLNENIGIRSNLFIQRKGYRVNDVVFSNGIDPLTGFTDRGDFIRNMTYLNLPVMFEFTYGERVEMYSYVGPYVSYLTKTLSFFNSYSNGIRDKEQSMERLNRLDFGAVVGTGLNVGLNDKLNFTSEVRVNLGLHQIFKDAGELNSINSVMLLFGLNFIP